MSIFVVKKSGDLLTTRQCLRSFVGLVSFFVRHGEDECVPETAATSETELGFTWRATKKYWNQRWSKLIILNGVLFWRTFHQQQRRNRHTKDGEKKNRSTNSQCRETATGAHDVSSRKRSALGSQLPSARCGFCLLLYSLAAHAWVADLRADGPVLFRGGALRLFGPHPCVLCSIVSDKLDTCSPAHLIRALACARLLNGHISTPPREFLQRKISITFSMVFFFFWQWNIGEEQVC